MRITGEGVAAYLTVYTDYTPDRARRFVAKHGAGSVEAMILSEGSAARHLQPDPQTRRASLLLCSLLAGRGFHLKELLPMALRLWGKHAAEVVARNPHTLLVRRLPSAGWKRTDRLFLDLGGRRDAPKRQVLAGVQWLRERQGDTWHDAEACVAGVLAMCGEDADPVLALRAARRWGKVAVRHERDRTWLALSEAARDEEDVARKLQELLAWTI